ncbi:MAG: NAD(P)H-hydrate dehydratase [Acidimicrobiales bacterium]|nr:NAD(P)H-hydrate dehydratase [Acidimicrobiales bacterium]
MIPVVTPEEMGAIDAAAPAPVEELIERAGTAVAQAAIQLLGGTYGRRVVVLAGKGNNGNDGRAAAARLRRRGVRVEVVRADLAPDHLPACDLVIDAAYGTGFRGTYEAPDPGAAPVLAVDIPSGVDGLTGVASGRVLRATRTVTFAALKPGLVFNDGLELAGDVHTADIGLDVSGASVHQIEAADVAAWLRRPPVDAHKWQRAVWCIAGSPGMTGAAHLAARAAQRAGAGYVRLSSPGVVDDPLRPTEAVGHALPPEVWTPDVGHDAHRFGAFVIGPGLGRTEEVATGVRALLRELAQPVVLDGDGLSTLGSRAIHFLTSRRDPLILTPHDGEFERLADHPPGPDRIASARALAAETGAVVLLKGHTTVVAEPGGEVLLSASGDSRLATAGTGDVLAGVIGALCASGVDPFHAAAAGAFIHGVAGTLGWRRGLVAGDLVDLLPEAVERITSSDGP